MNNVRGDSIHGGTVFTPTPVQFLLGQKWTRSSFHFANGGPGPVFAQPKVDLSSFRSAKSGPGSSGVLWNKSGLRIQIAFSDYDIKLCVHSFTTA